MKSVLVVLACAVCLASAHAKPLGESTNIEGWMVQAYSNDKTGQFQHCATSVQYTSGILLLFSIGKEFNWAVGLSN